jgi:hypothetical protein
VGHDPPYENLERLTAARLMSPPVLPGPVIAALVLVCVCRLVLP